MIYKFLLICSGFNIGCLTVRAQPWEQLTTIENASNSVLSWEINSGLFLMGYHQTEQWYSDIYGTHYLDEIPTFINHSVVSNKPHRFWIALLEEDGYTFTGIHSILSMQSDCKLLSINNLGHILLVGSVNDFEYDNYNEEYESGPSDILYRMVWLDETGNYVRNIPFFSSHLADGLAIVDAYLRDNEIAVLIRNPMTTNLLNSNETLPAGLHLLLVNTDNGHVKSKRPLILNSNLFSDYNLRMTCIGDEFILYGILDTNMTWSIFDHEPNMDKNREFICSLDSELNVQWLKYIADDIPYRTTGIEVKAIAADSLFLLIDYPARYVADEFQFARFKEDSTLSWTVVCQLNSNGAVVWGQEIWSNKHDISYDSKSFDIGSDGSLYVTFMHEKPVHFYSDSSKLKGGGLLLRYLGGELLGVREFEPYLNQYVWDRAYPVATSNGYCYVVFGEGVHGNLNGEKDLGADYIGRIAADFTGTESISPSSAGTLKVYPVPNNGVFNIQMPFTVGVPLSYHVFISDMSGRTIYGAPIEHGVSTATIDISTVETGIYNLLLTGGEEPFRGRVLVH